MRFIDPLKTKMQSLLSLGRAIPIEHGSMSYGSKADYDRLVAEIRSATDQRIEPVVVDFTPLERLGSEPALGESLSAVAADYRVMFLAVDGPVLESIKTASLDRVAQIAIYSSEGRFVNCIGYEKEGAVAMEAVRTMLTSDGSLHETRKRVAQVKLLELLSPGGVIHPHKDCKLPGAELDLVEMYGRWYLRMPNGMLVTCYLHLKKALRSPSALSTIAYEVICSLYNEFRPGPKGLPPCDIIVVPNNTALLIGATVQSFTEIPVCVIDKLGPIPSEHLAHTHTSMPLYGKKVCLLVEVSGTGSEIDRTILHLSSQHATVDRIIACYNLEVGRSLSASKIPATSLCRPKAELGYVYRSE